ncbi:MAG: pectate lyase [Candidatus Marinimicrobia bacterium]|nr:pectate lyase [Candidatus Neomarinimicrobiota bacterium]MCF7827744.1 pectate lyase [Candidatus Neomarinimicrobiota bacterium]MCF7881456.1 pectate lyase [Candidatus Neomarinimicrobiota bacterium]
MSSGAKEDTQQVEQKIKAFPGAEGFGAFAQGGRDGRVLHVTNLTDDGKGSLRWAIQQEGPRTVVFDVSGTIILEGEISIENPYITIAGQTAPGDGICLRDAPLEISTHDVVIRYLRSRLGDQGERGDAISISEGHDIIVDHCSASWSTDEVLSASTGDPDLTDVTVQWCFITEALNFENHGFGSLIRGTGGARYSYHHNLYAHNRGRNPRPGNYDRNPRQEDPDGLLLDFRNNVIYNWGGAHAGYNADSESITKLNYVGNYLIPGANSENNGIAYQTGSPFNKAYFQNNYYDYEKPSNRWEVVRFGADWSQEQIDAYKQNQPFSAGTIATDDPQRAFEKVLTHGGASIPNRDAVDSRIVVHVQNHSGNIIDSHSEVGGWPDLQSQPAPTDTDRDGMPDSWEKKNGLDPKDASDRNNVAPDGYTMLEKYLNSLVDSGWTD